MGHPAVVAWKKWGGGLIEVCGFPHLARKNCARYGARTQLVLSQVERIIALAACQAVLRKAVSECRPCWRSP